MRVYVASSWRNDRQPLIVALLRAAGHEVYDFREPALGECGFSWHDLDNSLPVGPADLSLGRKTIRSMLADPIAEAGFALDMDALRWCEACVLVLPCGRSAHLEAGWAAGAGKLTVGLLCDGKPDLMWKMLDHLVTEPCEIIACLSADLVT